MDWRFVFGAFAWKTMPDKYLIPLLVVLLILGGLIITLFLSPKNNLRQAGPTGRPGLFAFVPLGFVLYMLSQMKGDSWTG